MEKIKLEKQEILVDPRDQVQTEKVLIGLNIF